MWRLLFLLSFIITNSYSKNALTAVTKNLVVTKFDLIVDEDVNNDDPRIKSIVYSAKSYPSGRVIIYYVNPNAKVLATKLAQILTNQYLLVLKPTQIQSLTSDDNKYVQITINY